MSEFQQQMYRDRIALFKLAQKLRDELQWLLDLYNKDTEREIYLLVADEALDILCDVEGRMAQEGESDE